VNQVSNESCPICFSEPIEQPAITPCGHIFCFSCLKSSVDIRPSCPKCRTYVSQPQLTLIATSKHQKEVQKSQNLRLLIEKHGTKMAHLVVYVRQLFEKEDNKVIIFSQWDFMLHRIGQTLTHEGLPNVFCRGNVHQRNKVISSFQTDPSVRVLMLSLAYAASGTNLTNATHVILIDPVAGSKEEAVAIERQAIGRAHRFGQTKQVVVVRMIIKDTIEHELYIRNTTPNTAIVVDSAEATTSVSTEDTPKTTMDMVRTAETPEESTYSSTES